MHVNPCCNSWRQKCDQERSREDFIIKRPYNRNSARVECESTSDTGNNMGDWNNFKITQYMNHIPGKHEIKELQKTAILVTAHILRKVLMEK